MFTGRGASLFRFDIGQILAGGKNLPTQIRSNSRGSFIQPSVFAYKY
jgi:hypothetical protein